jgi:Domain of unknown function (DUF4168)
MYRMIISSVVLAAAFLAAPTTHADEAYDNLVQRLSTSFDRDGELILRIVAQGVRNAEIGSASERRARLEPTDIICVFGEPTGQHFTNVMCREYRFHSDNAIVSSNSERGAGSDVTASRRAFQYRIRERQALAAIAQLPGLPSMNDRLVAEGLAGLPLPQGLPSQDELEQFVRAYRDVNAVSRQFEPLIATATGESLNGLRRQADDGMVRAIEGAGLDWERYNEITEHVSTHPELFEYVRANYRAGS